LVGSYYEIADKVIAAAETIAASEGDVLEIS
jgi:hypothetical protein